MVAKMFCAHCVIIFSKYTSCSKYTNINTVMCTISILLGTKLTEFIKVNFYKPFSL